MTVIEVRPDGRREPAEDEGRRNVRLAGVLAGVSFAAVVAALWISWPVGVALGLVLGVAVTAAVGRAMHRAAQREELADGLDLGADDDLAVDFRRLRVRLGDDWSAFARATELVVRGQQASLAGLQRELRLSTAGAQHVMGLLEREGFVGPARGARRREVLVPRERAAELQELLGV